MMKIKGMGIILIKDIRMNILFCILILRVCNYKNNKNHKLITEGHVCMLGLRRY